MKCDQCQKETIICKYGLLGEEYTDVQHYFCSRSVDAYRQEHGYATHPLTTEQRIAELEKQVAELQAQVYTITHGDVA